MSIHTKLAECNTINELTAFYDQLLWRNDWGLCASLRGRNITINGDEYIDLGNYYDTISQDEFVERFNQVFTRIHPGESPQTAIDLINKIHTTRCFTPRSDFEVFIRAIYLFVTSSISTFVNFISGRKKYDRQAVLTRIGSMATYSLLGDTAVYSIRVED